MVVFRFMVSSFSFVGMWIFVFMVLVMVRIYSRVENGVVSWVGKMVNSIILRIWILSSMMLLVYECFSRFCMMLVVMCLFRVSIVSL